MVRSDTSVEREAIPGVSIRVCRRRRALGTRTSRWSTCSAGRPREIRTAPSRRVNGRGSAPPPVRCAVTAYVGPSAYQVTIRVHSPASVGASSSPTSALSRVDLPAFTLPAMATRRGSSIRRRDAGSRGSPVSAIARSSNTRT